MTARVKPPPGLVNPQYNSRRVGPDGIDVSDAEAEALERDGWTRVLDEPAPEHEHEHEHEPTHPDLSVLEIPFIPTVTDGEGKGGES